MFPDGEQTRGVGIQCPEQGSGSGHGDCEPVDPGRDKIVHMSNEPSANLPKVLSVLELLTRDELLQLNRIIIERVRIMQQIEAHGQMMNLRIGQRVQFTATDGRLIKGVLVRMNRKSVTIATDDGHEWRVSPTFVRGE